MVPTLFPFASPAMSNAGVMAPPSACATRTPCVVVRRSCVGGRTLSPVPMTSKSLHARRQGVGFVQLAGAPRRKCGVFRRGPTLWPAHVEEGGEVGREQACRSHCPPPKRMNEKMVCGSCSESRDCEIRLTRERSSLMWHLLIALRLPIHLSVTMSLSLTFAGQFETCAMCQLTHAAQAQFTSRQIAIPLATHTFNEGTLFIR